MQTKRVLKILFLLLSGALTYSCDNHIDVTHKNKKFISGLVMPLVGSIVNHNPAQDFILSKAYGAACIDPVYAKLFEIQSDGTIDSEQPLQTQLVGADARYRFDIPRSIQETSTVNYLVVADGCNDIVYKRPVTNFNAEQDLNTRTTIVSQVVNVNTSLIKKLNEADRKDIEALINSMEGDTIASSLDSLINQPTLTNQFTNIFSAPPTIILEMKPDVALTYPKNSINEMVSEAFTARAYHINPVYPIVYSWKKDGVTESTVSNWNYTPHGNSQGQHQIEVFVGMDDGSGNVDTSKPYFSKTLTVNVNNNVLPVAPAISIATATPAPRQTNSIDIDLATGADMAECSSFSHLAFTETPTAPAAQAFTISCTNVGTQTETVVFDSSDGTKNLYLWAIDDKGVISASRSITFLKDETPPIASITSPSSLLNSTQTISITLNADDATSGVASAVLEFSSDGTNFAHLANLSIGQTSYSWNVPDVDTIAARLKLIVTDQAGLITEATTPAFSIDSTPPLAPAFALHTPNPTSSSVLQFTVSDCSDVQDIIFTELNIQPTGIEADWQSCSTLIGAHGLTISGDGTHNIYLWSRDNAGLISSAAQQQSVILDTTAPVITTPASLGSTFVRGGSTRDITWAVTDSSTALITLSYSTDGGTIWNTIVSATANDGIYSWDVPALNSEAILKLYAIDELGLTAESTTPIIIDSVAPQATGLSINNGELTTSNRNVLLTFSALDTLTNVQAFCPQYNGITPLSSANCWIDLYNIGTTPEPTLSITDFPFQVGSIQGDYVVSVWFKDSAGNISDVVSSATISYFPDPAPVVSNFIVSSSDTPSSPLTTLDTTVPFGSDLYIRWNLTDDKPIPAGNISLSYTLNDIDYVDIDTNVSNAINGACTINAETTGCYKWSASSPTNEYLRIKLQVTDSRGTTIYELSNPLNTGPVKFLSGNTNLGIGGAATNAIIRGDSEDYYSDNHDTQALVVTRTGYIFYRYHNRGLVYISPEDGILRDVAFKTGTSTGDGGSVFNATFTDLRRMVLDYDDNILLWDGNRIRKFNTTTWTITTLFGGGNLLADGTDALSAELSSSYSDVLTATPDGRVYYNRSKEIWYYDPQLSQIKRKLTLTGLGTADMASWRATFDNSICPGLNNIFSFNKTTSSFTKIMRRMSASPNASCGSQAVNNPYYNTNFDLTTGVAEAPHPPDTPWSSHKFTGMDGNIYVLNHKRLSLQKYNSATNTFDTILGTNTNGRCPDGTPALSCPVVVMSAFVSEYGKVYFVDLGVLRTIDSDGNVQTIAGQPRSFGIGFNPISARYSLINFFEINGDDIYVRNELENQIVKLSLNGGVLEHIAGDTTRAISTMDVPATTSPLINCNWAMPCGFIIDPATNRLYHYTGTGGVVAYIDLATGLWTTQATGLQDSGTRVSYVGISPHGLLTYLPSHKGSANGNLVTLRVFNQVNNTSTHIYGVTTVQANLNQPICTGVNGTTCALDAASTDAVQTRYRYDQSTDNWLIMKRNTDSLYSIPALGGNPSLFETMNNSFGAFDFLKGATEDFVFYCSTDGGLYKRNITTDVETALELPISSMKCTSASLHYHSGRSSLIFAYEQNGLYGIAEYLNP